jgi:hypothetical protein
VKIVLACFTVVAVFVGSIALSVYLSVRALDNSNHDWCAALVLLTANPVPRPANPNANPSRERSYMFYVTLKTLERQFRC